MKKTTLNLSIIGIILWFSAINLYAQPQNHSISMGATYANQIWFGFAGEIENSAPKDNWDIYFELSGFGFGSAINPATGIKLWVHPASDTSLWATIDTAGMSSSWTRLYNSDTSWSWGALNMCANLGDEFDLGWGQYNLITHNIMGKRIFVIQLADGSFQKLMVNSLINKNIKFRHANLDGSNETTAIINKDDYPNKGFIYYSFAGQSAVDREPLSSDWEITFTQYTAFIPTPYLVSGVLTKKGNEAAKAYPVDDVTTFVDFGSQNFSTYNNVIGYDWKSFTGTAFEVADSTVYFVKTANQDIWKVIFTSFEGSSTGNIGFSSELLYTNSLASESAKEGIRIFPNPSAGSLVFLDLPMPATSIEMTDMQGKRVLQMTPESNATLVPVSIRELPSGLYFIHIQTSGPRWVEKLLIP